MKAAKERQGGLLFEYETYPIFKQLGIDTPAWYFHAKGGSFKLLQDFAEANSKTSFVAKAVLPDVTHKTEIGAIKFNITAENVKSTVEHYEKEFEKQNIQGVLFAEELKYNRELGSELLLSLYRDEFFGPCVVLGFGGQATEYLNGIMKQEVSKIIFPVAFDLSVFDDLFKNSALADFLEGGVRGTKKKIQFSKIKEVVGNLQKFGLQYSNLNPDSDTVIEELEINPAIIENERIIALDGVIRVGDNDHITAHKKPIKKIKNLLEPKTIAIAGASGKNPNNPSNLILNNLIKSGINKKDIYLIHPKENMIEGIPCVSDINALLSFRKGEPVDCLVVGVPAKIAGEVIAESFDKYAAHTIQIISAGFGETSGGQKLQEELTAKLKNLDGHPEKRPLVNGPNTLGNIYNDVRTLFPPSYKSSFTGSGLKNCALICQSGAFMITRMSDMAGVLAPKIAISVGNQMDLTVTDFFEYLIEEKDISAYGLYIEGLTENDGLKLMKLVQKASEKGKSVVIYKSGRTKEGMEAAKGHTAAMAGDYSTFKYLMKMSGAYVADTNDEFDDLLMLSAYIDRPKIKPGSRKLGVAGLSNAGFEKCAIADHLLSLKQNIFDLAEYSNKTNKRIEEIFNEHRITGVVDIHQVLDLSPMMNDEGFEKIIRATLEDDNVDLGIYSIVPETVMLNTCKSSKEHSEDVFKDGSILNRLIKIKKDTDKPFVVSFESGEQYNFFRQKLFENGIACFSSADRAALMVAKFLIVGCRPRD